MTYRQGFSTCLALISLCLSLVSVAVMLLVASASGGRYHYGFGGLTESRCIEGYKFVLSATGQAKQILDSQGQGIKCKEQ